MKFTDRSIKALKPRDRRYEVWEDNGRGFGVRVSTAGTLAWTFLYFYQGRPRRMTLGRYPAVSLATAHRLHAEAVEKLEHGIDPGARVAQQREAERRAVTVKGLCEEYLTRYAEPRKKTASEDRRILNKEVIPAWGGRKARDITRRDVVKLLDTVVDRGAPIMANNLLSLLKVMFNFGVERDIIDGSPCASTRKPSREKPRERYLSDDQIYAFWHGLENAKARPLTRLAAKFVLATGQRRGEVAGARKAELDLDDRLWSLPSARTKNGKAHAVPLSSLALELLEEIFALSGRSTYLFPSSFQVDMPMTPHAITYSMWSNREAIGAGAISPHDLRRTAATVMSKLGFPRLVVGKCLNHSDAGVTGRHYDMYEYLAEKRDAFEAWGVHIRKAVKHEAPPSNVVPIVARGQ